MFQDPTKSLLLWGSSGTGKTLALVAALKRKVSYYKRRKIPYKVLVSSFGWTSNCKQLLNDLKTKYGLQTIFERSGTEPMMLEQLENNLESILCILHKLANDLNFLEFYSCRVWV